ncbi:hypothetical protein [Lonepinella sp. MS14436]|uniref:hypothetical protein n=1 Tax=Lonepinella sp. MS14436 TaxID=3003619 RepID=UPI0036DE3729
MENLINILTENLECYEKAKREIEHILEIYEKRIKEHILKIEVVDIIKCNDMIDDLFHIQNELCVVKYKYNYPLSVYIYNFLYEFDRQDDESKIYLINAIKTKSIVL